MATVDELRGMAHDLYARARASLDPSKKQKLVKSADVTPHPRRDADSQRISGT